MANTNATDISLNINRKFLKLVWHQICASVFAEIFTGYTNQPQVALNHIKQCYIDSNGNQVCVAIFAYYQHMMNAMCPFAGIVMFPKSVCNALIDRMSPTLLRLQALPGPLNAAQHDFYISMQQVSPHNGCHDCS